MFIHCGTACISRHRPALRPKPHKEEELVFDNAILSIWDLPSVYLASDKVICAIADWSTDAEYVRDVLKKKCGRNFTVVPVVAIPGWFVKSKNQNTDILVINPKRGRALDAWLGPKENKANRNKVAVYLESVARSVGMRSKLTDPHASTKYDFWFNLRYVEPELRQIHI